MDRHAEIEGGSDALTDEALDRRSQITLTYCVVMSRTGEADRPAS